MTSAFLEVSLRRSCENERLHRFTFFYVQQWHVELWEVISAIITTTESRAAQHSMTQRSTRCCSAARLAAQRSFPGVL